MNQTISSDLAAKRRRIASAARAGMTGLSLLGGTLPACGTKKAEEKIVEVQVVKTEEKIVEKERKIEVPETKPAITKTTEKVEGMTLAKFTNDCKDKLGLVQLHATCAGNNSCRGLSFNSGTLIEHTCRGINTCSGMSCVILPADANLTGKEILEGKRGDTKVGSETECSFCHGSGTSEFKLPLDPTKDEAAQKTAFEAKSQAALVNAVAFGVHGYKSDGTAYANMPGFHKYYSRAEIERVVAHLKTLPLTTKKWKDAE